MKVHYGMYEIKRRKNYQIYFQFSQAFLWILRVLLVEKSLFERIKFNPSQNRATIVFYGSEISLARSSIGDNNASEH